MQSLAIQSLTIPVIAREEFALVAGQGGPSNPYTIGPGGDFDTTRPADIYGAGLILGNTSPAIEIPRGVVTDDGYEAIQIKELSNALFTTVYYNATFTSSGRGTIFLWPVPDTSANSLVLYRSQQLTEFATLTTSYTLPNGYEELFIYNVAERLALTVGMTVALPVLAEVKDRARLAMGLVKRANYKLTDMPQDPAVTHDQRGGYNILSGTGG